jgi:hypothetical protein
LNTLVSRTRKLSSKSERALDDSPLDWIEAHPGEIYYGSKSWANHMLRHGIKLLKDDERDEKATVLEVIISIRMLKEAGFPWQAERLGNWLHRDRRRRLRLSREAIAERREASLQ